MGIEKGIKIQKIYYDESMTEITIKFLSNNYNSASLAFMLNEKNLQDVIRLCEKFAQNLESWEFYNDVGINYNWFKLKVSYREDIERVELYYQVEQNNFGDNFSVEDSLIFLPEKFFRLSEGLIAVLGGDDYYEVEAEE